MVQDAHGLFRVRKFKIERINFDLTVQTGEVSGNIHMHNVAMESANTAGHSRLALFLVEMWTICGFRLPGFGDLTV